MAERMWTISDKNSSLNGHGLGNEKQQFKTHWMQQKQI